MAVLPPHPGMESAWSAAAPRPFAAPTGHSPAYIPLAAPASAELQKLPLVDIPQPCYTGAATAGHAAATLCSERSGRLTSSCPTPCTRAATARHIADDADEIEPRTPTT